jgi:hypothetical protein
MFMLVASPGVIAVSLTDSGLSEWDSGDSFFTEEVMAEHRS